MSNLPPTKRIAPSRNGRVTKQAETALDIAARYFVYKLCDATDGQRMRWQVLHGMGESAASISRAVERGWIVLQEEPGRPLECRAALTDEGRRLARMAGTSMASRCSVL
jgi:hypothetical protein